MDCNTCPFTSKCECKCKKIEGSVETASEWIAEYKCRLCGGNHDGGWTGDAFLAMEHVSLEPNKTSEHNCVDGSYGISDFQGMRKREATV